MTNKNIAFIDDQNLYRAITSDGWAIAFKRLRIYLRDKYQVKTAYYFVGAKIQSQEKMYHGIEQCGFEVVYRKHSDDLLSVKKGNVDTDIVYYMMRFAYDSAKGARAILISGDGDYWLAVQFLIKKDKFAKLLAPVKKNTSSLYYRHMSDVYIEYLNDPNIKKKIIYNTKNKNP